MSLHFSLEQTKEDIRDQSLFITCRRGVTWFLGEQKGGSVVTENPKGGLLKTLEGLRGGTTQICLENEDMGEGIAKVIKSY